MQETRIRASLVQVAFPQTTAWQRDQLSKCTALCNLAKMFVVDRRSHPEDVREGTIKGGTGFQTSAGREEGQAIKQRSIGLHIIAPASCKLPPALVYPAYELRVRLCCIFPSDVLL
jgi:hypothetical protein